MQRTHHTTEFIGSHFPKREPADEAERRFVTRSVQDRLIGRIEQSENPDEVIYCHQVNVLLWLIDELSIEEVHRCVRLIADVFGVELCK